jgi:hypothetical protein
MHRSAIVLAAALIAAPVCAEELAFDVVSYDVRIAPDFQTQSVSGQAVISFRSAASTLTMLSFSANTLDVVASLDGEHMIGTEVKDGRRLFHLPKPMRKGQAGRLVVSFKGKAPKGLVWTADTVYANYFTCDVMICDQDRPSDKAHVTFKLDIPPGIERVTPDKTYTSSYLMGFAAGKLQRVELEPRLTVLAAPDGSANVRQMFQDTARMRAFFEAKAGVRVRDRTYTQVLVEGGEAQEAANHAIIGLDNVAPILKDPHEDWVIAHELAHQWWGNAVTCADWSELWLNEGLTVFMVAAWKEHRWGRADYDRELALANKRWEAAKQQGFDVPLSWRGAYPSLRLKRAMAYAKAVVFLDTLRRELGEEAFWRAIKSYTRTNWDGTVRAQDLQRAFERSSNRDLSPLFQTWVYGAM